MMYVYVQNFFVNEVLELFYCMRVMGFEFNDVILVIVLLVCNNVGLVDEGRRIFDFFSGYFNIRFIKEYYVCMVDIYGRVGRFQEVELFIN